MVFQLMSKKRKSFLACVIANYFNLLFLDLHNKNMSLQQKSVKFQFASPRVVYQAIRIKT